MKQFNRVFLHSFLAVAMVVPAAFGQVELTRETDVIHVKIGGKPFADFHYGTDVAKPYLAPLRAASGTPVTRQFPMVEGLGETTDHKHHRGLWIGYIDVNGFNFWENEYSYKNPKAGRIVTKSIDEVKSGKTGTLRGTFDWLDPSGKALLMETRSMAFSGDDTRRQIDIDWVFTAKEKCAFADGKDGVFGIRLADPLTQQKTGTIVNSLGAKQMKGTWGKTADWVDYSGEINGEKLGIAIFDHPTSFHHPARWHSRDYGLFGVNPIGSQGFDPKEPKSNVVLNPGEKLHFRYLVIIHEQLDLAKIGEMYNSWSGKK